MSLLSTQILTPAEQKYIDAIPQCPPLNVCLVHTDFQQKLEATDHALMATVVKGKHYIYLGYLGVIDGKLRVKVGSTDNGKQRFGTHKRTFPNGFSLCYLLEHSENREVERQFKKDCKATTYRESIRLGGKTFTECWIVDDHMTVAKYSHVIALAGKKVAVDFKYQQDQTMLSMQHDLDKANQQIEIMKLLSGLNTVKQYNKTDDTRERRILVNHQSLQHFEAYLNKVNEKNPTGTATNKPLSRFNNVEKADPFASWFAEHVQVTKGVDIHLHRVTDGFNAAQLLPLLDKTGKHMKYTTAKVKNRMNDLKIRHEIVSNARDPTCSCTVPTALLKNFSFISV